MTTKRDFENRHRMTQALVAAGITYDDVERLRRISMTLQRWHEGECGDSNNYASWCITRGYKANGKFEHDDGGLAFEERHAHTENKAIYTSIPDRERGALKRLAKIMAKYPTLKTYVQGDPRGCALYILRQGDTPTDLPSQQHDLSCCYTHARARAA